MAPTNHLPRLRLLQPSMQSPHRLLTLTRLVGCCRCRGLLDTGANVVTLRLWGSRAEPFLQSLHASFAVGALVAPLLAERFISQGQHSAGVAAACAEGQGTPSVWLEGGLRQREEQLVAGQTDANVEWAFWISSFLMMPSAISLTVLTPRYTRIVRISEAEAAAADGPKSPPRKRSAEYQRQVLGLGLIIFGLYVGAEIGCKSQHCTLGIRCSCSYQLARARSTPGRSDTHCLTHGRTRYVLHRWWIHFCI